MLPVTVREVIPDGTVMLKDVEAVPLVIGTLDGRSESAGLLDSCTVIFCGLGLFRVNVTVACVPGRAGLGEKVIELRTSMTQGAEVLWTGGKGGVFQGALLKSKNSSMSGCAASRGAGG